MCYYVLFLVLSVLSGSADMRGCCSMDPNERLERTLNQAPVNPKEVAEALSKGADYTQFYEGLPVLAYIREHTSCSTLQVMRSLIKGKKDHVAGDSWVIHVLVANGYDIASISVEENMLIERTLCAHKYLALLGLPTEHYRNYSKRQVIEKIEEQERKKYAQAIMQRKNILTQSLTPPDAWFLHYLGEDKQLQLLKKSIPDTIIGDIKSLTLDYCDDTDLRPAPAIC